MGARYRTYRELDPWHYDKEFNADGTERHISVDGARYHVLSYAGKLVNGELVSEIRCSEPNCEINKRTTVSEGDHNG